MFIVFAWPAGFDVPTYTWSARSFDTPGASVMSCTQFRLFKESSRACSPLMTVEALGVVSSTATGEDSTVTTSATSPTSSVTSTVRRVPTSTCTPLSTCFLKLGASTLRSYLATGTSRTVYWPSSFVVTVRTRTFFSLSVTLTVAPLTAAPLASLTVPTRLPVISCAWTPPVRQ